MYRKKAIYICDNCGSVSLPRRIRYGDLTYTAALPEGWEQKDGRHICARCMSQKEEKEREENLSV